MVVQNDYKYLGSLPLEELEKLLSQNVSLSSDEEDDPIVDAIIEEMIRKEKEIHSRPIIDVDAAWKEFQERFNTPEGEGLSLYPNTI